MLVEDLDVDRIADDVAEVILQRLSPQLAAIESAIEQLRGGRDERKLTVNELAKELNTSISTVRRFESAIEQLRGGRDERKLTVKELAKELNTSISTVRRLVASGGLPHVPWGREIRFSLSEVLESLKEQGKCPPKKKKGQRGSVKAPQPKT